MSTASASALVDRRILKLTEALKERRQVLRMFRRVPSAANLQVYRLRKAKLVGYYRTREGSAGINRRVRSNVRHVSTVWRKLISLRVPPLHSHH